jgi:hypothetical protein
MKKHVLRTSIMTLLVAMAGHAQSSLPLRAYVPFDFVAGGATFKAGQYTVNQNNFGPTNIRSADGKASAFLTASALQGAGAQSASRLIFNRYGSTYQLAQIWTRGDECGRQLPVDRREPEPLARQRLPHETIVLAAR